jgi:hypothetical protein
LCLNNEIFAYNEKTFFSSRKHETECAFFRVFVFSRFRDYYFLFWSLNLGIWNLPFDSFDLEALDRLAQGGESFDFAQDREPVERLVEPFVICLPAIFLAGCFRTWCL